MSIDDDSAHAEAKHPEKPFVPVIESRPRSASLNGSLRSTFHKTISSAASTLGLPALAPVNDGKPMWQGGAAK